VLNVEDIGDGASAAGQRRMGGRILDALRPEPELAFVTAQAFEELLAAFR